MQRLANDRLCDGVHLEPGESIAIKECDGVDELFAAARDGSTEALGQLFENCRSYLTLIASIAVKNRLQAKVDASDLVQETFFEAHRAFGRFQGDNEEELLRWLARILENRVGTTLKRYSADCRNIRRELDWFSIFDGGLFDDVLAGEAVTPATIYSAKEERDRVREALSELPDEQQSAIRLRVEEELPFEMIGQRMMRSAEAARKLYARAVIRLQELLEVDNEQQRNSE